MNISTDFDTKIFFVNQHRGGKYFGVHHCTVSYLLVIETDRVASQALTKILQ